jgi:hypothetical protein
LHKTAEECFKEGLIPEVGDPDDCYVASTRCAMYWRYDEDARLEGEYVYEIEPGTLKQIPREHWLSVEELTELVRPYLPHGREVGTSDAFQGAAA